MISKLKKKISKRFGIIFKKEFFFQKLEQKEKVQKYERIDTKTGG